jgi:hypothetical protein
LLSLLAIVVPTAVGNATGAVLAASAPAGSGYWMLSSDGHVYAFGDAETFESPAGALGAALAVDLEPTAPGDGYWVLDQRGRVHTYRAASHFGDLRPTDLVGTEAATSLSATPAGKGYWIFTSRGRAVAFGDAVHYGDMAGTALNGPVLDSIPTPSGKGYYMVASDGGIFSFGDAKFYGSMGDTKLNAAVQSLVPDGDGVGYWLVASDGGIFSFEAPFKGSMGSTPLNQPVTGMVRFGNGYLMVGEDGGIFNFSDQRFFGSLGDRPPAHPIVSVGAFETQPVQTATNSSPAPSKLGEVESPEPTTTTTTSPATTTTTAPSPPPVDDPVLPGLPTGEPTDVLPCQDGSGETAMVWYYGPESDEETWGAQNGCEDQWIVIDLPGDSVSDPYGAALSIAPGAQFHHKAEGFTADSPGAGSVYLSPQPLDGTDGCPVGYTLYELRPEHDGRFRRIGSCPDADELGWYDEEEEEEPQYDGPTCFGHAPNVIGTEGDDVFPNQDAEQADQPWYIVGLGGNDTLDLGEPDSGTPDVYFCGGDGDDIANGMYDGFDGGPGDDTAVSHCGGTTKDVEHVTAVGCSDDLP